MVSPNNNVRVYRANNVSVYRSSASIGLPNLHTCFESSYSIDFRSVVEVGVFYVALESNHLKGSPENFKAYLLGVSPLRVTREALPEVQYG